MLNSLKFGIRAFLREWRAMEWWIIFFAIFFAVASVTALHFYTDRLARGFENQGDQLLGGQLVLSSPVPINPAWFQKAEAMHLTHAEVWSYPSMLTKAKAFQMINLQAVSVEYPLLSSPKIKPERHTAWIDKRLAETLNLKLNDSITIGESQFSVVRFLSNDMDQLNTGWMIAPRVMIRLEDVPATKTVLPGSRVDYRLLLAGNKKALADFQQTVTKNLQAGQRFLDSRDQVAALKGIISHFENYLQIILLTVLMMSGIAILFSVQLYLHRHYQQFALWRTLGARSQQITWIIGLQLFLVAICAGLFGMLCGYLTQIVIANLFHHFITFTLPAISYRPIFLGFITALFLLFTFAYPLIYLLPRISPLAIWRGEISLPIFRFGLYLFSITIALLIFLYLFLDLSLLTIFFIDILLLTIGFLYVFCFFILLVIKKFRMYTRGFIYRGLSELVQHPESVGLQFVGLTLILLLLWFLFFVRTDLVTEWQNKLPVGTPNYFLINIAPTDLHPLSQWLERYHIKISALYPMVRGRLIALNNKEIIAAIPLQARNNNALHRELNLSWMITYPADNHVVLGRKWTDADKGKHLVSVEAGLAKELNLHLGDQLTFQVAGESFSARVANFRSLNWTSFNPNFFMIFTPGLLEQFPTTYITSIYLEETKVKSIALLQQAFPNITVIDVASLLTQIQNIIVRMTLAIQYLFLFALAIGVLIFVISVLSSLDERRLTSHLISILGATRKFILGSLAIELGVLFAFILLTSYYCGKWGAIFLASQFFSV